MAETRLEALPPADAIAALERRRDNPLPSGAWHSVDAGVHADTFTVARSAGFDILGDIASSLHDAQAQGRTYADWAKDVAPILKAKGWWGETEDERGNTVQLGCPRRLRIIYDTNLRVSHDAGLWAAIDRRAATEARFGRALHLRYVAVLDRRTRPAHRAWHGTTLPQDHPWWTTHAPRNGWRCRCTVESLTERDMRRYGVEPTDAPPETGYRLWTNPSTGEVQRVPAGIDPGWAHNPGRTAARGMATLGKLAALPPDLAAVAPRVIPDLPALVREDFKRWVAGIDLAKPAGEVRPIGLLSPKVVTGLTEAGAAPTSATVMIRDHDIAHMLRDAKAGKAIDIDDVARLPEILAEPEAVLYDRAAKALVYVFSPAGDGSKKGKVVVRVDYAIRTRDEVGKRSTANLARTAGLEGAQSPRDPNRYELLDGEWP